MRNSKEVYYKILNIPTDSSPQEIRNAYKNLVKKWHPDKHPPSSKSEAESHFKAITEAYEALNDLQENRATLFQEMVTGEMRSRPKSDRILGSRKEGIRSTGNVGIQNAIPSFSKSILRKAPPTERKLECTLEELSTGCKKEFKYTRDTVAKNGLIEKKEETVKIKVKPGWKKGTKITYEGLGDERRGYLPADLVIYISEKKHSVFKRSGNDLVLKTEVPLVCALTGWTFSFRLLNGEKMSCMFNDEIIYPGYEKVFKGYGMPLAGEKGKRGDLRIKFLIVFPKKLTDEQRLGLVEILNQCK
ncbi:DnaJ protein [Rhynchospora pubera]|uniref:DnaJ protein n=1 Tax=Rhynchospora pubera TaxID=906938 RepID=A0AAV8G590_9POAL|nr:DnaJ protein [Rhynchospora pubera]